MLAHAGHWAGGVVASIAIVVIAVAVFLRERERETASGDDA
jgi:hypothetical protein